MRYIYFVNADMETETKEAQAKINISKNKTKYIKVLGQSTHALNITF